MKLKAKDIREKNTFNRVGYTYSRVFADDTNHIYIYQMTNKKGEHRGYELVKARPYKNPDGGVVYRYPTDEEFGTYGWYIYYGGRDIEMEKIVEKIAELKRRIWE